MEPPDWVAENNNILTASFTGAADPARVYALGVDNPVPTENGMRFTIPRDAAATREEALRNDYVMVFNNAAQRPDGPEACPVIEPQSGMKVESYNLFTGRADVTVQIDPADARAATDANCALIPTNSPALSNKM